MKVVITILIISLTTGFAISQNPVNASYSKESDGNHVEKYMNGNVRCSYKIIDSNLDSVRNCYYRNGKLWIHEVFNNGKFNGTNYSLTEDGDTIYIESYKNDTLLYTKNFTYYPDRKLKLYVSIIYTTLLYKLILSKFAKGLEAEVLT